jgi:hypothetical protein
MICDKPVINDKNAVKIQIYHPLCIHLWNEKIDKNNRLALAKNEIAKLKIELNLIEKQLYNQSS